MSKSFRSIEGARIRIFAVIRALDPPVLQIDQQDFPVRIVLRFARNPPVMSRCGNVESVERKARSGPGDAARNRQLPPSLLRSVLKACRSRLLTWILFFAGACVRSQRSQPTPCALI